MNYLAHAYLSGDSAQLKVGNFLGDWVKGSDYLHYPEEVGRGIMIHRDIDSFTDRHPIAKQSASRFLSRYAKYAGVIIDILYDHFLAANWSDFSKDPLHTYIMQLNTIMINSWAILPERLKKYLPAFMEENWMERYATLDGIRDVLNTMSRRTSLPSETEFSMAIIESYYEDFKQEFYEFFFAIIEFIEEKYAIVIRYIKD